MKQLAIFLSILLFCTQRQVSGQDKVLKCSESNDRCELPFNVGGKLYEACTTDLIRNGRPWCPTKVYNNGSLNPHYCMECWGEQRCYYNGESFPDSSWILSCPPGCVHVQKSTYGTDNDFSASSFVCAAAMHEGLVTNETGGLVVLEKKPWKKAFVGAEKNGVKTYAGRKENFPSMTLKASDFAKIPDIVFAHDKKVISSLESGSVTSKLLNDKQAFVYGMTSDVRRGKIFWSDVSKRTISSATFNGKTLSNIRVIVQREKVLIPEYLAFDWIHSNLFWTDRGFHSVSVSGSNGQNVLTLIKRDDDFNPKGIAVDPRNGYFYIANFGPGAKIEKCAMFAKDQCETIIDDNIRSPTGVAIDTASSQVCWADSGIPQISCSKLDGSGRRNMEFSTKRLKQPFALMTYLGQIYWTDWLSTMLASANIQTWENFHIHLGDITKATGLIAFDQRAQPLNENQCSAAACRHLCVPRENGYMCLCSDGHHLQPDGSCHDGPLPQRKLNIYVADFRSLKRLEVNLETSTSQSFTILQSLGRVTAVSVDTLKNVIYWSDAKENKIEFAPISDNLAGPGRQTLVGQDSGYVSGVEGIAVDSVTRLLYWTDTILRSVFVTNLDPIAGQHHIRVLVKGSETYMPRGIALDPKEGHFYVVDSQSPYAIQRCESRGEPSCSTLFQLGIINRPEMIAIDFDNDLFYVTQRQQSVLSINLLGRKAIPSNLIQPYGIGLFENRVYVSDIQRRYVMSMNKDTGKDMHIIARGMIRPLGIFLHEQDGKPADYANVCSASNCKYLCVPTPIRDGKRYTCLCPDRMQGISNAKECQPEVPVTEAPTALACRAGYKPSRDGKQCVDVEECVEKIDGCQQVCRNTIGSFFCECNKGYQLQDDKKTCALIATPKPVEPCSDNPCQNGGTCQVKDDGSGYVCFCDAGFKGENCRDLDIRILKQIDSTGAIHLRCICPKAVASEILWMLNRLPIDPSNRWSLIRERGRLLTMHRPYFANSGNFTCQFRFQGIEYIAGELVIIRASPRIACGLSAGPDDPERMEKGQKILGGKRTQALHAPFVAMLYKTTDGGIVKKGVFCGGAIIDTKHIVTAAHCFQSVSEKEIIVYVGKLIADVNQVERLQQSSEIHNVTIHPNHNPESLNLDLAIVRLKTEIYYTEGVKPLCIPKPDNKDSDLTARPSKNGKKKFGIVYGWGLTQTQQHSKRMIEIDLPILKQAACKKAYPGEISSYMFCAGGERNRDTCEGDSGGPFTVWSGKKRKWYLAGIVSWGESCGKADKPGVYVRIGEELRRWIHENTDLWI